MKTRTGTSGATVDNARSLEKAEYNYHHDIIMSLSHVLHSSTKPAAEYYSIIVVCSLLQYQQLYMKIMVQTIMSAFRKKEITST